jgi:ABC-type polysaccharide/polyol phosphate export permease
MLPPATLGRGMMGHLTAVWAYRHFWLALVRSDLRARYRRSVLGVGWSLLQPIAMSGVLCLVFSSLFPMADATLVGYPAPWRAYAAYLLAGMMVWEYLRNSLLLGCSALIHNEAYIRQCPLPYAIYPLRTVLGTTVHFLISLTAVSLLVCLLRGSPEPLGQLWAVLPAVPLLLLFAWGVATVAAFATVYFHDFSHLFEVAAQLAFFLTPIMYTADKLVDKGLGDLLVLNPVVPFIELVRQPLALGQPAALGAYLHAAGLAAAAAGLGVGAIGWLQKKVIFHL